MSPGGRPYSVRHEVALAVDGNERVGHAALEVFLVLNGYELDAAIDAQQRMILAVAAGNLTREESSRAGFRITRLTWAAKRSMSETSTRQRGSSRHGSL